MLRLEGLVCAHGAFQAVHGLDLAVAAGSVTALLGANGAGKSSTIMAVAGHVAVPAGRILLEGDEITGLPAYARVRRGIALAPEGRQLFPDLTVAENLAVGGYSRSKGSAAANLTRVYDLFPRLAERAKQSAGSLSGGEQQMLAIGRALMAEPRLLMIDEVSLGLMPKMVALCYQAIARLKADGMTILLVEQNTRRALGVADWVCVLESGRAVWQGDAQAARHDPDLIEAYLGSKAPH
ncbi:MAG: ABC transporter ATP-binding protein [Pseudomonadota bacterium]